MIYQVWFKSTQDGRAQDTVFLDLDYRWAGELEAANPKELVMQLATTAAEDSELMDPRQIAVGDVLVDANDQGWIFTPLGVFSMVTTIGVTPDNEESA